MGELYHYGVKGMKWGVRRRRGNSAVASAKRMGKTVSDNEKERREQMNTISKRKDVSFMDRRIARYARKSPAQRMATVAVNSVAKEALNSTMRKENFSVRRAIGSATNDFAVKEVQAQSLSKKYNKDGSGEGSKNNILTKEVGIAVGYNVTRNVMSTTVNTLTGSTTTGKAALDSLGNAVMKTPYDDLFKK